MAGGFIIGGFQISRNLAPYPGAAIDADVAAFAAESGATDVAGLNNLVKYLKAESIYDNFVIYPMKSAQNAGSGATVYSLGGLTTNDMTLVNSPTWGAGGITTNGTNQYGYVPDFLGSQTRTVFGRTNLTLGMPGTDPILATYGTSTSNRGWILGINVASGTLLFRSSDGTNGNQEIYNTPDTSAAGTDTCVVGQWIEGGGRSAWHNKTSQSLSLLAGSAQTGVFNTTNPLTFSALLDSDLTTTINTSQLTGIAMAVCNQAITTAQRETITDLINAL